MKFYNREKEMVLLRKIEKASKSTAQFTVLTGRRRIGKTKLLLNVFGGEPFLYFFVSRKAEKDLCQSFTAEIEEKMGIPMIGNAENFSQIFEYVMKLSKERPLTLVIDEFQDFLRVNPSVLSDIQRIWDLHSADSKINLIVSGSINRMMTKIFKNKEEPLYNRHDHFLTLRPFTTATIQEILAEYNPLCTNDDLLTLYAITGGVAKYVQLLMENGAWTTDEMIDAVFREDSYFLDEGRALLMEEFGKEYGVYFSILTTIASGNTSRADIENAIGKEAGGYLTKLEDDYALISKHQPIFEKTANKRMKYQVCDNFLSFWFRFVFKYSHMVEIGAFEQLKRIVRRDLSVFSGRMLERYFKAKLAESGQYTRIGSWWDRNGMNEIDIITENEIDKEAAFIEIKKNIKKYDEAELLGKIKAFESGNPQFKGYKLSHYALSLDDMTHKL